MWNFLLHFSVNYIMAVIMPPPHRAEALSQAFVWRLSSVCLSRTSGLTREQRPRKSKIGTEVAHVTSTPLSRSKVKVTRPLWSVVLAGQHGHTVLVTYPYTSLGSHMCSITWWHFQLPYGPLTRFSCSWHFWSRISEKGWISGTKLLLNTNRKPDTIYRMIPLSMTVSDLWPHFKVTTFFCSRLSSLLKDIVTIAQ